MSSFSHRENNERQERRDNRRQTLYAESVAAWDGIRDKEQKRFHTLAIEHAKDHPFCAAVAHQKTPVSQRQAATLMKIATERSWRIPVIK